jgi:hypothetical protein
VIEQQQPAEDELHARDLIIRALTALGLIGAALAALLAVHPS